MAYTIYNLIASGSTFSRGQLSGLVETIGWMNAPASQTISSGQWIIAGVMANRWSAVSTNPVYTTVSAIGTGLNLTAVDNGYGYYHGITQVGPSPQIWMGQYTGGTVTCTGLSISWNNTGTGGNAILSCTAVLISGLNNNIGPNSDINRNQRRAISTGFIDDAPANTVNPLGATVSLTGDGAVSTFSGSDVLTAYLTPGSVSLFNNTGPTFYGNYQSIAASSTTPLVNSPYTLSVLNNYSGSTTSSTWIDASNPAYGTTASFLSVIGPNSFGGLGTSYGSGQLVVSAVYTSQSTITTSANVMFRKTATNVANITYSGNAGAYDIYYVTSQGSANGVLTTNGTNWILAGSRLCLVTSSGNAIVNFGPYISGATISGCYIQVASGDTTFSGMVVPIGSVILATNTTATYSWPNFTGGQYGNNSVNNTSAKGIATITGNLYYNTGYAATALSGGGGITGGIALLVGQSTQNSLRQPMYVDLRMGTSNPTGYANILSLVPAGRTLLPTSAKANGSSSSRLANLKSRLTRAAEFFVARIYKNYRWGRKSIAATSSSERISKSTSRTTRANQTVTARINKQQVKNTKVNVSWKTLTSRNNSLSRAVRTVQNWKVQTSKKVSRKANISQSVSVVVTRRRVYSRGVRVSASYTVATSRRATFGRRVTAAMSMTAQTTKLKGKFYLVTVVSAVSLSKKKTFSILIPVSTLWNMAKSGTSKLLIPVRAQINQKIFVNSDDWSQPNNGQPVPGTGSEIFDDVPEEFTQEDNPLGTDTVPFHE